MHDRRMAIHRSFWREVQSPIQAMRDVAVQTLCELHYGSHRYPMYCLQYPADSFSADPKSNVLISAGVHGDEPAGVYAALDFLRNSASHFVTQFRFYILACVNPSGFEANTLETMNQTNLNRTFGCQSQHAEVRSIESWLAEGALRFRLTFDLHEAPPYYVGEGFVETDNPDGTYLYETVTDGSKRIGRNMIESLAGDVEVCQWPTIYKDTNNGGVIAYPDACQNDIYAEETSLDAYLNGRYTHHSFTTETPTFWSMERRVETHLTYLRTALELVGAERASVAPAMPE